MQWLWGDTAEIWVASWKARRCNPAFPLPLWDWLLVVSLYNQFATSSCSFLGNSIQLWSYHSFLTYMITSLTYNCFVFAFFVWLLFHLCLRVWFLTLYKSKLLQFISSKMNQKFPCNICPKNHNIACCETCNLWVHINIIKATTSQNIAIRNYKIIRNSMILYKINKKYCTFFKTFR